MKLFSTGVNQSAPVIREIWVRNAASTIQTTGRIHGDAGPDQGRVQDCRLQP